MTETFEFTRAKIEADRQATALGKSMARREATLLGLGALAAALVPTGVAYWFGGMPWALLSAGACADIAVVVWMINKDLSSD